MSFLWGNTANQQPDPKKFANISNDQINSNQQAQPVKYLAGRNYVAGDYISPAYNPRAVPVKSKTGKTETSTTGYKYFADFALVFCTGGRRPVDAVYKVIVDSDIRWRSDSGVVRVGNSYKEIIQVDDLGEMHLYWGTESQPIDDTLLKPRVATASNQQDATTFQPNAATGNAITYGGLASGDKNPYSGHYDEHPAYRGQCYAVFKDWKLGRDRTSVPNIQLELARGTCWHSGGFLGYDGKGVNPIGVLFEWLTDPRFGMGIPESLLNLATFATTQSTLEAYGARISPLITSQQEFRQSVAELLEYYDGWIRRNGTQIEVGVWPKGNIPVGAILLDDDLLAEPELEPQGWGPTINEVTVVYKDRNHHFNDYTQNYRDPNNFRITGGPRPETYSRPWITDKDLAKAYATTIGTASAKPFTRGDLTVKREWLTKQVPVILPGTVFTYRSGFYGLDFLVRLLEVEYASDKSASAKLTVEWERSKWPSLYTPPGFHGPGGFVIGPRAIWQKEITEVPYLLLDQKFDTQLICLAVRGNVEVQGYRIWISLDGGTTYDLYPNEASTSSFASFGRILSTFTLVANGQAVWYHTFGIDQDEIVSQTAAEQADDNLLLFIDDEVMSVGNITAYGSGQYMATLLRGRYGTTKVSHPVNSLMYFLYRSRLRLLDNAGFIPGTAIKIKLQPFTADLDLDITTITPIDYTIQGFADIAAPVLSPAPGTFTTIPLYVTVSNPPAGFVAHFTRDGTPALPTSPVFPAAPGTLLNATKTIRVRFYNKDNGRTSPETVGVYTKITGPAQNAQCAAPSWTYSGVLMHSSGTLTLAPVTSGSQVHWTKTSNGIHTSGTTLAVALLCNFAGDQLEYWATKDGMDESDHHTIDNTKETTFGGGGHMPPRSPPNPV